MKTRTGFVSNSSSSSFLIAEKPASKDICPHCGRSDLQESILDMIDKCNDGNNQVIARGTEDTLKYFDDRIKDEQEYAKKEGIKPKVTWEQDLLDKTKQAAEDGYDISYVGISDHDDMIHYVMKTSKSIKVLYGD